MKKYLIVLLLTCLVACQKSKTEFEETISENKITEVFKIESKEARKNAYLLLNSSEKNFIWKTHFEKLLKQNLSVDKKNIIAELKNTLKPQLFANNANAPKFVESEIFTLLKYKIEQLFTEEEIINYFINPTKYPGVQLIKIVKDNIANRVLGGNGWRECTCHEGNVHGCGLGFECFMTCKNETYTRFGCGWLFLESCNGGCPDLEP